MTTEHFERIIPLASLTSEGMFYISCAFEPSLHPKFSEILKKIPPRLQKRVSFTTNLATNFSDQTFETLSALRLNRINISVESFKPEVYEQTRKNAKYDRFINNLERMVYYFKKEPNSPRIRFITLVSKLNSQEIPFIIEKCHTLYHAFESEIRYPWITPTNTDWFNKVALPVSDWESVAASVQKLPFRFFLIPPRQDGDIGQENVKAAIKCLWIRSDGLLQIEHGGNNYSFPIETIKTPCQFFKKKSFIPAQ